MQLLSGLLEAIRWYLGMHTRACLFPGLFDRSFLPFLPGLLEPFRPREPFGGGVDFLPPLGDLLRFVPPGDRELDLRRVPPGDLDRPGERPLPGLKFPLLSRLPLRGLLPALLLLLLERLLLRPLLPLLARLSRLPERPSLLVERRPFELGRTAGFADPT